MGRRAEASRTTAPQASLTLTAQATSCVATTRRTVFPIITERFVLSQLPNPHITYRNIEAAVDPLSEHTNLALLIRYVCCTRQELIIHVHGNCIANGDDGKQVRLMPQPERSRPITLPQVAEIVVFISSKAIISSRIHEEKVPCSL